MSVYYFVQTGIIHHAHPAGFFIFLAVVTISLVFGKSFCSWICPVGTLSEYIGEFGDKVQRKLFKKVYRFPGWLDYPLRSLKYLLLGFFVYSIFYTMTLYALGAFLDSPYNLISDVKMYYFFAEISPLALKIILILFVLSIFVRNFWCRYLCPYGALLGIASLLSPNKVHRNQATCIDCNLCTRVCPSQIKVDRISTVISDECTTCMNCADVCPVADTLELKNIITRKRFRKSYLAAAITVIFLLFLSLGMLTGNWQNDIPKQTYLKLHKKMDSLGHPRSPDEFEELNDLAKRGLNKDSMQKNKSHTR
jgi:polyferredoxin